jgi:hypothetical protein
MLKALGTVLREAAQEVWQDPEIFFKSSHFGTSSFV